MILSKIIALQQKGKPIEYLYVRVQTLPSPNLSYLLFYTTCIEEQIKFPVN